MPNRTFSHVAGQLVEVFKTPHFQQVRDLANGCFSRYEAQSRRELHWDTPGGDGHADQLLRAALLRAVHRASDDPAWLAELRDIQDSLRPGHALELLYGLAWDGGGDRPIGEPYGWARRLEQKARGTTP